EGVATNPRDVDLAMIFGTGFPPFRGGLLFWADQVGARAIVEKLQPYEPLGQRFKPTALLLESAKGNKKLYDA
ncbi:MAG TPA: hypothetical protein VEQ85_05735, partial [Lacipirellulaceae bacterium]|nr:hypothetical protein [Lacipirellulaceae bacterium]